MAIDLLLGRKQRPPQIVKNATGLLLFELDLAFSEEHSYKSSISSYPVEDGLDISDHIRVEPERLILEGFITNTPIKYLASFRDPTSSANDRVVTIYELLLSIAGHKIYHSKKPDKTSYKSYATPSSISKPYIVDIYTKLRVFTDMVLESLTIPRTPDVTESMKFKAEFVRIRKVALSQAKVQYTNEKKYGSAGANDQAAEPDDKGKVSAVEPKKDNRTIALKLYQGGVKEASKTFAYVKGIMTGEVK